MKELIVICDSEIAYAENLTDYLRTKIVVDCEVMAYSDIEIMIAELIGRVIKCLLIDEDLWGLIKDKITISKCKVQHILLLTNIKASESMYGEANIYKYQSAQVILRSMESLFNQFAGECITEEKEFIYEQVEDNSYERNRGSKTLSGNYLDIKSKIKHEVQEKLINEKGQTIREKDRFNDLQNEFDNQSIDDEVYDLIDEIIQDKFSDAAIPLEDRIKLRKEVFNSIRGFDVLSELIEDDNISEIMINGYNQVFVEREGKIYASDKMFESDEALKDIIQKIVAEANRTVNMASPIVDARLRDGSRVNVVLPPVSLSGPTITIRKFPDNPLDISKLLSLGAIDDRVCNFLNKAVVSKHNMIISGGTGSGKTTMLNALSSFIPADERIITIEDSAELKIQGIDNLVRLETRNANADGCNEITIRDLIKAALRMRGDRIIVGEVRGEEAIDMLQAFSVGNDGSMSTLHANSAEDAISRLETLIMLNSDNIPLIALKRQIASSVDLLIQMSRQNDGSRKLVEIIEIVNCVEGNIITNPLFVYRNGKFIKCNDVKNKNKFIKAGIDL